MATAPTTPRSPFSAEERTDDLLLRRFRDGDVHAREELVERLMPMVHRLARMYPAHEHADDVVQVAALGLAKAIDRYDPEFGVPLRGYAVPTILGEIRRYRRDHCWAVRPPRRLQERILKVTRCVPLSFSSSTSSVWPSRATKLVTRSCTRPRPPGWESHSTRAPARGQSPSRRAR